MSQFLSLYGGTIFIGFLVAAGLACATASLIRGMKRGKSCSSCDGCAGCGEKAGRKAR